MLHTTFLQPSPDDDKLLILCFYCPVCKTWSYNIRWKIRRVLKPFIDGPNYLQNFNIYCSMSFQIILFLFQDGKICNRFFFKRIKITLQSTNVAVCNIRQVTFEEKIMVPFLQRLKRVHNFMHWVIPLASKGLTVCKVKHTCTGLYCTSQKSLRFVLKWEVFSFSTVACYVLSL